MNLNRGERSLEFSVNSPISRITVLEINSYIIFGLLLTIEFDPNFPTQYLAVGNHLQVKDIYSTPDPFTQFPMLPPVTMPSSCLANDHTLVITLVLVILSIIKSSIFYKVQTSAIKENVLVMRTIVYSDVRTILPPTTRTHDLIQTYVIALLQLPRICRVVAVAR